MTTTPILIDPAGADGISQECHTLLGQALLVFGVDPATEAVLGINPRVLEVSGFAREMIPCPAELEGLPVVADGVLGAVGLRRQVIPVLDLRPVLKRDGTRRPGQVIVIVAFEGRVLGLLAEQVRGVRRSILRPSTRWRPKVRGICCSRTASSARTTAASSTSSTGPGNGEGTATAARGR